MSGHSRDIHGHKQTMFCPLKKCKYTSKVPYTSLFLNNKNSIHSKLCPKHRLLLISKFNKNKLHNEREI